MIEHSATPTTLCAVAHNGDDIIHYVERTVGLHTITGQPFLETFETRELAQVRMEEINPTLAAEIVEGLDE